MEHLIEYTVDIYTPPSYIYTLKKYLTQTRMEYLKEHPVDIYTPPSYRSTLETTVHNTVWNARYNSL